MRTNIKCLGPYLVNLGSAIAILWIHVFLSESVSEPGHENSYMKYSMYILIGSTAITETIFIISTIKIISKIIKIMY